MAVSFAPILHYNCLFQGLFLDLTQGGMRFDNMDVGEFPVYASLVMLVVDTVLYALIALYLENIMPGKVRCHSYLFMLPLSC